MTYHRRHNVEYGMSGIQCFEGNGLILALKNTHPCKRVRDKEKAVYEQTPASTQEVEQEGCHALELAQAATASVRLS